MKWINRLLAAAAVAVALCAPACAGVAEMLEASVNCSNTTVSAVSSPKEIDISGVDQAALWVTTTNKSVVADIYVNLQRSPDGTSWSSDYLSVTQSVAAGAQKTLRSAIADADLVGVAALRVASVACSTNIGTNTVTSILLAF